MSHTKAGKPYRKAGKKDVLKIIQMLSAIYPLSDDLQQELPEESVASLLNIKPVTLARLKKQFGAARKLQESEDEEKCRELDHHMRTRQLYRDKKISLTSLSAELGIGRHKLSSLINNHYHQTFSDYVNSCRIDRIKEQLRDTKIMQRHTIEMLANDAGFASRSAFYNAFKKETGISPREYLQGL